MPQQAEAQRPVLAYFGQDRTDSAVIRRIASFQAAGIEVLGATFRREKFNRDARPTWEELDLGTTRDRDFLRRLWLLARAGLRLARARGRLRRADLFMARNIDMCLLAIFARALSGSRAPLVYEVLDVHRVFARQGKVARLARAVERWALRRTRLLVVSSPAFVERYFRPVQGYDGDYFLLENKICAAQLAAAPAPQAAAAPPRPAPGQPWVIGWFGTMRCVRSLSILADLADRMPDEVRIYLRGYPTETGVDAFRKIVDARPNMIYEGEFKSPQDLAAIYGAVHFAWCFDFHDAGANSRWLLPNRLYDAAFHGVPSLALSGTQTGDRIEAQGLGWTLREPLGGELEAFLRRVDPAEWTQRHEAIAALPKTEFCDSEDAGRLLDAVFRPPRLSGRADGAPASSALPRRSAPGAAARRDTLPSGAAPGRSGGTSGR